MKTALSVNRISKVLLSLLLASSLVAIEGSSQASATPITKLWFKQVGTDYSVRPSSEPSGSLVREGTFNSIALTGTTLETLTVTCSTGLYPHWNAPFDPYEVIVDSTNNKLYWHNGFEPAVVMSDLDGGNCERIVQDNYYTAAGIALDSTSQYLYTIYNNEIRKVDIAGKTNSTLTITGDSFTAGNYLQDLVIEGNTMYVSTFTSSSNSGRIVKVDLTTLVATNLITGRGNGVTQIAVDSSNNKIYWANMVSKTLSSANLTDGSNIQVIRNSAHQIYSVAFDSSNSKLYVGEIGTGAAPIFQIDPDGSNPVSMGVVAVGFLTVAGAQSGGSNQNQQNQQSQQSSGQTDAEKKAALQEAERKRQEKIRNAQLEILRKVRAHIDVVKSDLAAAETALLGEPLLVKANSDFLLFDTATTIDFPKVSLVLEKYAVYERISGNIPGLTYAQDLVKYGLIKKETPLKSLITRDLIALPAEARDTYEEINAYLAKAIEDQHARKERLATIIAKIHSR